MITYYCPKCGITSERSVCGKCGGRTDAESHLYWCPTCKVPLYGKDCENCGQDGIEFAADVRPVFPEERLLIEVLLGKPLTFIDGSVWASAGDRYYVDGKKIVFSTIKHSEADADEVRRQWNEWSSCNNYEAFDRYAENFIKANRTRLDFIEMEAMQYIQETSKGFDAGTMFVSFSGGKDSTVVSDLVMRALGRSDVLHIFGNTTLEFPQTIDYVSAFRKDHPTTPTIMRPCKLRTQCVRIWKHDVDFFHLLEVSHGESYPKLLLKSFRHVLQYAFQKEGAAHEAENK